MNIFQKIGAFLARIVGTILIYVGAMGLAYYTYLCMNGRAATLAPSRVYGSVIWLALGIVILLLARPLGWLWGRGLD